MNAPQITLLCLWAIGLGSALQKHGQPKKGEEDVITSIIGTLITAAILYWGGFWE